MSVIDLKSRPQNLALPWVYQQTERVLRGEITFEELQRILLAKHGLIRPVHWVSPYGPRIRL